MKFYHYTIADRLVKILIDGCIKAMEDEVCLVWVTASNKWDKTAFYGYPDDVLDNAGRIRITLKGAYPSHKVYAQNIGELDRLEFTALEVGVDIYQWGVSPDPINITQFEKIELWKNNTWVEFPFKRICHGD